MLIIHTSNRCYLPTWGRALPSSKLEAGIMAQLYDDGAGGLHFDVSDGTSPSGIADDNARNGKICVWNWPGMLFETNQLDLNSIFMVNNYLYCNSEGKFTSSPINPDPIAVVASINNNSITATWFGKTQRPINASGHKTVFPDSKQVIQYSADTSICSQCKSPNPYPHSNQSDGSFRCWSCRNGA